MYLFILAVGFITFVDSLLSAFPGQALCSTVPRSFFVFVLCITAAPRVRIKILIMLTRQNTPTLLPKVAEVVSVSFSTKHTFLLWMTAMHGGVIERSSQ